MISKKELHTTQKGICPVCNHKNDIKVMIESKGNKDLICFPCSIGFKDSSYSIDMNFVNTIFPKVSKHFDSPNDLKEHLLDFPNTYVLVEVKKDLIYRRFWSWQESSSPFNSICVTKTGEIARVILKDLTSITVPTSESTINKNIKFNRQHQHLVKDKESWESSVISLSDIEILPKFSASSPSPLKIGAHAEYFNENKAFIKPISVVKGEQFTLLDGYTIYLAARELEVKDIEVLIVG